MSVSMPKIDYDAVYKLASEGASQDKIAEFLKTSSSVLRTYWRARDPKLNEVINRGRQDYVDSERARDPSTGLKIKVNTVTPKNGVSYESYQVIGYSLTKTYKKQLLNYELVKKLASDGWSKRQIAIKIGAGYGTVCTHYENDPKFREAFDSGLAEGIGEAASTLKSMALSGNLGAIVFWLKNRDPDRWRDRQDIAMNAKVQRVAEGMSDDQLLSLVKEDID